ncbi:hypothetical protein [Candidatus Albibeggiatoa sp. nov. NOAA]|uniref:hypothetical protein n=1 Tax=Candidatus Albibeggiatoa sp. nov. NOAA TaxID=3162724 RepID=UPI00330551DB|nr:hypothetical protein [Thiotrichaceae bacterium]
MRNFIYILLMFIGISSQAIYADDSLTFEMSYLQEQHIKQFTFFDIANDNEIPLQACLGRGQPCKFDRDCCVGTACIPIDKDSTACK